MKAEIGKNWFEGQFKEYENDIDYLTELKIIGFTERLVARMDEKGMSRVQLARKLGVSKSFVTKLLNGTPNLTIKTMVSVAQKVGCELDLDMFPKGFRRIRAFSVFENQAYAEPVIGVPEGGLDAAAAS